MMTYSIEEAILLSLNFCSYGRRGPIPAQLYASAHVRNSKMADFDNWYVTGPPDRSNYVKGPFSRDTVARVVATGRLRADCFIDDKPVAYILNDLARQDQL